MEVERALAGGGVHGLQQPAAAPFPGAMGGGRSAGSGTSSLLAAAVQEMAMVQRRNKAIKKPPRATLRLPAVVIGGGGGGGGRSVVDREDSTGPAPRRSARAALSSPPSRQPLAKRVARSMLARSAPPPDERRKVLTCCCARLPPGLSCALHQCAPGRTWMLSQRAGAGGGEAVAPRPCGHGRWVFSEYARWRRSVWMPSRFYLERVDDRQPREPPIELDAGRRRANCT